MRRIGCDKHSYASPKSLHVSGTTFPLLESDSDVIECQDLVIQEGPKISKVDYFLSLEPASEKNGTNFSTFVEMLEDLSAEITDNVDYLLLNEKTYNK